MKIRRRIGRSSLFGAVVFSTLATQSGCSGDMKLVSGCQSDNQCTGDQICRSSDGKCVPRPEYTTVTIEKIGDGSGSVTSDPAGLDCGNTCSGMFEVGSPLTLTATPASGSKVGSFSVGCASGTTTCQFSPESTDAVRVLVNFSLTTSGGPAALCNSFGFCWENPKPTGNRLNDVAVVAPGDVWAVGDGGTILHRTGTTFTLVSLGLSKNLYGVWGSGTDVYIVGEGGLIFHGVNGSFNSETSGITTDLYDVHGASGLVVAVGAGGRIVRRTSSWSPDTNTSTAELRTVYVNNASDAWALGAQGTAVRFNGSSWSASNPAPFSALTMRGAAGSGGTVYAIDSFGGIYNYTSAWTQMRSAPADDLYGVAVIGGTPYVAGTNVGALVMHYTGSAWQRDVSGSDAFRAIAGSSQTDLWAVGESGTFWQSDGSPWTPKSSGITASLSGVFATDAQHAWAVGNNGTLLVYNGSYFAPISVGSSTASLNGVWASGASDVLVVGSGGSAYRYNGSNWLNTTTGTLQNLRAVFGVSSTRAFAVGDGGTALTWDGSSWAPLSTGGSVNLRAVWASSASDIWAAGDGGKVLHSTGGAFSEVTGPATTAALGGIFGTSSTDFWVSADTMFYHYTGGGFTAVTSSPAVSGLRGIFGSNANDLYAVGAGGALLHYTGVSWTRVTTGAGTDLAAVVSSQRKLWVVGSGGTVLRQEL